MKHLIMPKRCVRNIQRPVKKVTFKPVLVTVPEEEKEEVIEHKPSLLDRTVVDIPERPFREDIGVTLPPCVETVRTLHSVPETVRFPNNVVQ